MKKYIIILLFISIIFGLYLLLKREKYKDIKYLYCFICHQETDIKQIQRIKNMMYKLNLHYIICIGGHEKNLYDEKNNFIYLNCDDKYCGLPDKIIKLFNFITNNSAFNSFTHFVKLDEDMLVHKNVDKITDYMGYVHKNEGPGSRYYHIGRCGNEYSWNNTPYKGIFVPWCNGGLGYILSRKSAKIISKIKDIDDEYYEDLMVAKHLKDHGISPIHFNDIYKYFTYKIM